MNPELQTLLGAILELPDSSERDLLVATAAEWMQHAPHAPFSVFLDRYDSTERALLLDLLDSAVKTVEAHR